MHFAVCTGNKKKLPWGPNKKWPTQKQRRCQTEREVFVEVLGVAAVATRPRTLVCILSAWPSARAGSPPIAELLNVGPHLNNILYVLVSIAA